MKPVERKNLQRSLEQGLEELTEIRGELGKLGNQLAALPRDERAGFIEATKGDVNALRERNIAADHRVKVLVATLSWSDLMTRANVTALMWGEF